MGEKKCESSCYHYFCGTVADVFVVVYVVKRQESLICAVTSESLDGTDSAVSL